MNFRPIKDNVLISPIATKYEGILLMPEGIKEDQYVKGYVEAVGSEIPEEEFVVGSIVLYSNRYQTTLKVDGEPMVLVKEEDVVAVLADEE